MVETIRLDQPCPLELECPPEVHVPGPASLALARYLFSVRDKSVLDLGCGTGLFAVAAAKLGAREVVATDLDPAAVLCARRNAERNGARLDVLQGSLFEPVAGRTFDLVVSNPPQTPWPGAPKGTKLAGDDGLHYFEPLLEQLPRHLEPGGQFLTFLISVADTRRFEDLLRRRFRFRPLPRVRRDFSREEFDAYQPGLFDYLVERRRRGLAEFAEEGERFHFWAQPYLASLVP
jgi:release factor glutamine methyltransferase